MVEVRRLDADSLLVVTVRAQIRVSWRETLLLGLQVLANRTRLVHDVTIVLLRMLWLTLARYWVPKRETHEVRDLAERLDLDVFGLLVFAREERDVDELEGELLLVKNDGDTESAG